MNSDGQVFLGSAYATFDLLTKNLEQDVSQVRKLIDDIEKQTSTTSNNAGKSLEKLGTSFQRTGDTISGVGDTFSKYLTVPLTAGFALATKSALGFEDKMASVRKSTGATTDEIGKIGDQFLQLSENTRTSASDLADIATIGGQIGISSKDIVSFTGAIDKMNIALGDEFTGGAEEVTQAVGGLRQIFGDIKTDNVDKDLLGIGNALNVLGASGLATAPVVSDFASRIGGMTGVLGESAGDVLGLSATLQELQVNAERGGSAVGRIFQAIAEDTDKFAKVAGISGKKFKDMVNTDINGAFIAVLEGTNRSAKSATDFAGILDQLGLTGVGNAEVFSKLAKNTDLLREKQDLATKSLGNTDSIMQEYNIKNETGAANLEKLRNKLIVVAQQASPALIAALDGLTDKIKKLSDFFLGLSDNTQKTIVNVGLFVAAIGPVLKVVGSVTKSVGTLMKVLSFLAKLKIGTALLKVFSKMSVVMTVLRVAAIAVSGAITALAAALGIPVAAVVAIIAAIVALIVGIVLLIKNFSKVKKVVGDAFDSMKESVSNAFKAVGDYISGIWDKTKKTTSDAAKSIVDSIVNTLKGIGNFFSNLWETIKNGTVSGIKALVRNAIDFLGDLVNFFATLPEKIVYTLAFIVGRLLRFAIVDIPNFVVAAVKYLSELPGKVKDVMVSMYQGVFNVFSSMVQSVTEFTVNLYHSVVDWFTRVLKEAPIIMGNMIDAVVNFFVLLPDRVITWLVNLAASVSEYVYNLGVTMGNLISAAIDAVVDFFAKLPGRVINWIINLTNSVMNYLRDLTAQMKDAISGAINNIVDFFRQLPQRALDALGNFAGLMKNKLKSIAASAWEGFKDGLGIHSPSYIEKAFFAIKDNAAKSVDATKRQVKRLSAMSYDFNSISPLDTTSSLYANASTGQAGAASTIGSSVNIYGDVNNASDVDANMFLQRLSDNSARARRGIATL
jgi:TP901 family phage tail tape measure protein